jgi:hypothetical protein
VHEQEAVSQVNPGAQVPPQSTGQAHPQICASALSGATHDSFFTSHTQAHVAASRTNPGAQGADRSQAHAHAAASHLVPVGQPPQSTLHLQVQLAASGCCPAGQTMAAASQAHLHDEESTLWPAGQTSPGSHWQAQALPSHTRPDGHPPHWGLHWHAHDAASAW